MSARTYRGLALRVHVHQGTPVPRPVHLSTEVAQASSTLRSGDNWAGARRTAPLYRRVWAGLKRATPNTVFVNELSGRERWGGAKRLQDLPTSAVAYLHKGGAWE